MAELIDVLTEDGTSTGVRKEKDDVHRDGDWHRASHLWVITPEKRVLLQFRAWEKENHPALWDIASAGHLSAGETAVEATLREAEEELGLTVDASRLTSVGSITKSWVLNDGTYLDNEIYDIFLLRQNVDLAELRLQAGEVDGAALIPLTDLRSWVAKRSTLLVPHWEEYEMILEMAVPPG